MEENNEKFHCSAELHLARMLPLCGLIYPWAFRFKSRRFYVSVSNAAAYFDVAESTMQPVYQQLRESGFFNVVGRMPTGSYIYEPVEHQEWVKIHPKGAGYAGTCCNPPKKRSRLVVNFRKPDLSRLIRIWPLRAIPGGHRL